MTKALLVVGSAPCAYRDLDMALELYPNSEVMLVNGACTMIENAEHMLAGHTDKTHQFFNARKAAFPGSGPIRVHATWAFPSKKPVHEFPEITDWWGPECVSGATSAGKAALIGMQLGFAPIILCGCPMDGSGYSFDEAQVTHDKSCARVGDPQMQNRRMIRNYKDKLIALAKTTFAGKVFSMSGFTRQHLGPPPRLSGDTVAA